MGSSLYQNRLGDFVGTVLDAARYHPFADRFRPVRARLWFWKTFRPTKYETLRRINLGCGPNVLPGVCNIDVNPRADLRFNFLNRFPLPEAIADWVYCEHTLEHLHVDQAARVVREVLRILRPGGIFRISVPRVDIRALDRLTGPEVADLSRRVFMHEHRSLYSPALLDTLFREAGFPEVAHVGEGKTRWMPQDALYLLEHRKSGNLVAEARKEPGTPQRQERDNPTPRT